MLKPAVCWHTDQPRPAIARTDTVLAVSFHSFQCWLSLLYGVWHCSCAVVNTRKAAVCCAACWLAWVAYEAACLCAAGWLRWVVATRAVLALVHCQVLQARQPINNQQLLKVPAACITVQVERRMG